MKIIMGFPSPGVLTSGEIFLKRHILAEPAVVQELSGTSMTKKVSLDGHSGCSSFITDGDQDGFDSSFSSAVGLLHDPVFWLWVLTFVLELQCSCSLLRKGIIISK